MNSFQYIIKTSFVPNMFFNLLCTWCCFYEQKFASLTGATLLCNVLLQSVNWKYCRKINCIRTYRTIYLVDNIIYENVTLTELYLCNFIQVVALWSLKTALVKILTSVLFTNSLKNTKIITKNKFQIILENSSKRLTLVMLFLSSLSWYISIPILLKKIYIKPKKGAHSPHFLVLNWTPNG